ncbi:MAG TPA: hypothetical protein VFI47_27940 [Acidimicrobiales bacterium]|nr:hypothetical protein [Acidimicrobiales bacterium]
MSELERALAAPSSTRVNEWATIVRRQVARLKTAFERHVANAEADGGLFEDVIDHEPRLVNRVERLRRDHGALTTELAALAQRLNGAMATDTVATVREKGIELPAHFAHHRYLGSELVYEAFNVDIEAAD